MNPIINRKQDILYKDLAVDLTGPPRIPRRA